MELDRNGLEVLGRPECLALLDTVTVGRVGLSMGALPVVLPVHFALDAGHVVVGTTSGSKLDAALAGAVVAFEADSVDDEQGVAWSVLVRGSCRVLDGLSGDVRRDLARRRRWVVEGCDRWIGIGTDLVSGRRMPGAGRRRILAAADVAAPGERPEGRSVAQGHPPAEPGPTGLGGLERHGPAQPLGSRSEVA